MVLTFSAPWTAAHKYKSSLSAQLVQLFVLCKMSKLSSRSIDSIQMALMKRNMKLTAILASAVLIEAHVSSLRSKMMMNFTPGCLVLQEKIGSCT